MKEIKCRIVSTREAENLFQIRLDELISDENLTQELFDELFETIKLEYISSLRLFSEDCKMFNNIRLIDILNK